AQVFRGVSGATVKVELARGVARDALVRRDHLRTQAVDVETNRTADGHDQHPDDVTAGSRENRRQRGADARTLLGRDEALQQVGKPRLLHTGDDVLPPVRGGYDTAELLNVSGCDRPAADFDEVVRI